jgi:hypothetical protein
MAGNDARMVNIQQGIFNSLGSIQESGFRSQNGGGGISIFDGGAGLQGSWLLDFGPAINHQPSTIDQTDSTREGPGPGRIQTSS